MQDTERNQIVTELFTKYKGTMIHTAYKILDDWHLAEDAVSDAIIKIIQEIEKYNLNDCNKTRSLIVIITRSVAIDLYRVRKRQAELPLEDFIDYPSRELSISDRLAFKEACSEIAACAAKLNESYSLILYLNLSLEFSDKEIARILDLSYGNVRARLSRARKALLDQLNREELISHDG